MISAIHDLRYIGVFFIVILIGCTQNDQEALKEKTNLNLAADIDSVVTTLYDTYNIKSGFVAGVIKKDTIIYAKGFGYSYPEKGIKMTPKTPVYIASQSKSLMATLARKLEREGVIDLDGTITDHLPDFSFDHEGLDASTITLEELITHTHGLENPALTWWTAYLGSKGVDQEMKLLLEETYPLKNKSFNYSNLGTITLGLVINEVTEKHWKDHLETYIFQPLNMDNTSSFVSDFDADQISRNIKNSTQEDIYSTQTQYDNTMHAAGGQFASTYDLLNWLSVFINDGKYGEKQFFTPTELDDILESHAKQDRQFGNFHRTDYSLGWDISDFNGERMWSRFGSNAGQYIHVSFMPDHDIGIVVFNSGEGFQPLPDMIASYIYNTNLEKENAESLLQNNLDILDRIFNRIVDRQEQSVQSRLDNYPLDVGKMAGNYTNKAWGVIKLTINNDTLMAQWENMSSPVYPIGDNTYDMPEMARPHEFMLHYKEDGSIESLEILEVFFQKQ